MSHIEGLCIKPVENGHIVSYLEYKKVEGSSDFEPMMADRKEFVFQDKDADEAFKKYKEMVPYLKKEDND